VCDKIDWMENGWMDWIEWMWKVDVESGCGCGKWRGSGSHTAFVQNGENLFAYQLSMRYLYLQLRQNYRRFRKRDGRHIEIVFPVSNLTYLYRRQVSLHFVVIGLSAVKL